MLCTHSLCWLICLRLNFSVCLLDEILMNEENNFRFIFKIVTFFGKNSDLVSLRMLFTLYCISRNPKVCTGVPLNSVIDSYECFFNLMIYIAMLKKDGNILILAEI